MSNITREKWLEIAAEKLNKYVFDGNFDVRSRQSSDVPNFQIACAKAGMKGFTYVMPYQGEDVSMDDFYPITITIDHTVKDIKVILANLAYILIKVCNDEPKGKRLKSLCKQYYFDGPYSAPNPSAYAKDLIDEAYRATVEEVGEWPGRPVMLKPKDAKTKTPNTVIFFCPECGMEYKVSRKKLKDNQGCPVCICGTKCGREEEPEEEVVEDVNIPVENNEAS